MTSGRDRRSPLMGILLSIALISGCRHPEARGSEKLPAELFMPAGAREVVSHRQDGIAGVSFKVKAPYPADDFLAAARARLASRGWKELPTDWLNPTIPSSHARGWTSFLDSRTQPSMGVHQWSADWQNRSGDVVFYSLRYQSPVSDARHEVPPPAGDDLEVTEMLIPATTAKAMQDDAVRRAGGKIR